MVLASIEWYSSVYIFIAFCSGGSSVRTLDMKHWRHWGYYEGLESKCYGRLFLGEIFVLAFDLVYIQSFFALERASLPRTKCFQVWITKALSYLHCTEYMKEDETLGGETASGIVVCSL